MNITSLLKMDDTVCLEEQKIVQTMRQYDEVILFGGGITGVLALRWCHKNNIIVAAICDNNPNKVGTFLEGRQIISSKELRNNYLDQFVLITCDAHASIKNQLLQMGYDIHRQVGFFEKLWVQEFEYRTFIQQHIDEYSHVYDLLADKKSQDVFIGMLNYKLSMNQSCIIPFVDKHDDMYFDKELIMTKDIDCFVDVGAYIGDTLENYQNKFKSICKKYICFEPNSDNIKFLKNVINRKKLINVQVFEQGISNEKRLLKFNTDSDAATRISEDGNKIIECTTIDDELLNCEEMSKSLLKLDIEGSEYAALVGGEKVIQKYHPILAVCVYHKPEDMFVLPLYIKKMFSGYKLYLRQYEESVNETVCYAIPSDWGAHV